MSRVNLSKRVARPAIIFLIVGVLLAASSTGVKAAVGLLIGPSGGTGQVITASGGQVGGLNSTPINADHAVPLGYLQANYSPTAGNLWSGTLNGTIYNGTAGAGNVGIGTTGPSQKLDVEIQTTTNVNGTVANSYPVADFTNLASGGGSRGLQIGAPTGSIVSPVYLKVNGTSARFSIINQNDVENFTILEGGNVGLGTTAPQGMLQIGAASWGTPNTTYKHVFLNNIDIMGRPTATDNYIISNATFDTSPGWYRTLTGYSSYMRMANGGFSFYSGDTGNAGTVPTFTETMTILTGGNVGIGTAAPTNKLHVNAGTGQAMTVAGGQIGGLNSTPLNADQAVPLGYLQANYSPTAGNLWSGTLNGTIYNGTAGAGNVGIGVTTPSAKLDVYGTPSASLGAPQLAISGYNPGQYTTIGFGYNGAAGYYQPAEIGFLTDASTSGYEKGDLIFATRNVTTNTIPTERVRITSTGNVGIGTTNPKTTVDIASAFVTPAMTGTGQLLVRSTDTATADKGGTIQLGGNYNGTTYYSSFAGLKGAFDGASTYGGYLAFYTNSDYTAFGERMRINSAGLVGIGTTNPLANLDVYTGTNNHIQIGNAISATTGNYVGGLYYISNKLTLESTLVGTGWQDVLINPNGGNVGIGNTAPEALLQVGSGSPAATATYLPKAIIANSSAVNFSLSSPTNVNGATVSRFTTVNGNNGNSGNESSASFYGLTSIETLLSTATSNASGNSGGHLTFLTKGDAGTLSERVRITSAGNVGIGTTGPTNLFHVNGGTGQVMTVGGGQIGGLNSTPLNADQAVPLGYLQANYAPIGGTSLWSGTLNGTIYNGTTGAGNVGIGTTTPTTKLSISNGNSGAPLGTQDIITLDSSGSTNWIQFLNPATQNAGFEWSRPGSQGIGFIYYDHNINAMMFGASSKFVFNTGNVGIGTTNPIYRLTVQNDDGVGSGLHFISGFQRSAGSDAQILVGYEANGSAVTAPYFYSANSQPLAFYTGGANRLHITSAGSVGIGTTAPGYLLDVTGTIRSRNWLVLGDGTTAIIGGIGPVKLWKGSGSDVNVAIAAEGAKGISFFTNGTATEKMVLTTAGNVGIGTTGPTNLLHVNAGTGQAMTVAGGQVGGLNSTPLNTDQAVPLGYLQNNYLPKGSGTATGDLNMGGYNILNVNKLTVNTIDPLYTLNGTNYSTYASSISGGVKEEYVGKAIIATRNANNEYEKVIDFASEPEGSDLWVWRQVVSFNPENVEVFLTPYGSFANTYYLIKDNKLIFRSDRPVTLSYRLIGRRFDWLKWPTKALDQKEKGMMVTN